jgi:hypothetical protein
MLVIIEIVLISTRPVVLNAILCLSDVFFGLPFLVFVV